MLQVDIEKSIGNFHLSVNFEAEKEITGILGSSGCGKSMTLRCIAGIDKPDRGRIILEGRTLFDSEKGINLPPQKRKVGYLFQNYALFPNMTVEKNILCGLRYEKNKQKQADKMKEIIALLQLEGLEKHLPVQLSGGQAQRVALARILVNQPRLLMLDEPFSALDTHLRGKLQIQMKSLLEKYDAPVLMVTHNRNEAYHLCRKLALIDRGVLFDVKPTKKLFADPGFAAAAEITGCKNIIPARKSGDYEVAVPDWGLKMATAQPVGDDLCAIGIRAHYFNGKTRENCFPVEKIDEMEEPFEWIIRFRYEGQSADSPDIWWRMAKDRKPTVMPSQLGILPVNVLLLYPEKKFETAREVTR